MSFSRARVRKRDQYSVGMSDGDLERPRRVANLMWDRRVRRGLAAKAAPQLPPATVSSRLPSRRPKPTPIYRQYDYSYLGLRPPDFDDESAEFEDERKERESNAIDLSEFLEEKTEPVRRRTAACQTDVFRPPPPESLYVPVKTGIDVAMQVDGDMVFDFDRDVAPVVQVMADKTIEQCLLEVMHEESVSVSGQTQEDLIRIQEKRSAQLRALEDEERATIERRKRILEKATKERQLENVAKTEALAQTVASKVVSQVKENAMRDLVQEGFFKDTVRIDVETSFVPWLQQAVSSEVDKKPNIDDLIDSTCSQ